MTRRPRDTDAVIRRHLRDTLRAASLTAHRLQVVGHRPLWADMLTRQRRGLAELLAARPELRQTALEILREQTPQVAEVVRHEAAYRHEGRAPQLRVVPPARLLVHLLHPPPRRPLQPRQGT